MRLSSARRLDLLVRDTATRRPEAPAAITTEGVLSFGDLDDRSDSVAAALRADGAERGMSVGLLAPNSSEWLVVAIGAMKAGCSVAAFNTWARDWDLQQLIPHVPMHTVFTVGEYRGFDFVQAIASVACDTSSPPRIVRLLGGESDQEAVGFESWLAERGQNSPSGGGDATSPSDVAFVLFTSGSTSAPKAVPLLHRGLIENGFAIGERQGVRPDDRVWLPVPLFWSYGCANALMAAWTHGAAVVLEETFSPESSLSTIEATQSTLAYLLPNITQALMQAPNFSTSMTRSLRGGLTIGSSSEIALVARELAAPEICNIYGSTEVYGNCCVTPHTWDLERRMQSNGPPLPGVTLRVFDAEAAAPVVGSVGEIQVSGYVTPGYVPIGDDPPGLPTTSDGFFRTGDLGVLHEDGTLVYTGRASEMIKTGGINVSPLEVEEFLSTAPGVKMVAVVGIPDERKGEVVTAFVVPVEGREVDSESLRAHCRGALASFKVPAHFLVVDELPTTSTNKIARTTLRDQAISAVHSSISADPEPLP